MKPPKHISPQRTLSSFLARLAGIAVAGVALALSSPSAHAQLRNVNPFLECIEITPGGFNAHFGYESFETQPTDIFIGPDNFFTPAPGNRGQISLFLEGYHRQAFRISYQTSNGPILTWNLQGVTVPATVNSPICPAADKPPITASIALNSGGAQTTPRNTAFAQPIRIRATANGQILRGLTLKFTPPATGASAAITPLVATTDANGIATVNAVANGTAGTYNVSVAVGTSATPTTTITFGLTNQ
jgi:hypothetical protein